MKIVISGSTGFIGSSLVQSLKAAGHEVYSLVRTKKADDPKNIYWNPETGEIEAGKLEGIDIVINLAGENISSGRWTDAKKKRIRNSRIKGTRLLCETLAGLSRRPQLLINTSAIGFYGSRGEELLTEKSLSGKGFLVEVCQEWEAATTAAEKAGVRVVKPRFGIVLSKEGGVLGKMLTPFKLGLGGVLGSGEQYMSWIALDDLIAVLQFIIANKEITGPINAVAPYPVTNRAFTKTLGTVLQRPTILPVPAPIIRLLLGEMGQDLLLASTRVTPDALLKSGFTFQHPELKEALEASLRS